MNYIKSKYIIQPVVFLLFSFPVYSQSIHVTGKVINEKKEAVERVNVVLRHVTGGRIIAFAQTSETGNFELKKALQGVSADSLELGFSCVGYASQTCRIPPDNSQPLLVELTSSTVALREVVVSARSIMQRHDTVTYLVSSFSTVEDRTIGDVLKKIPGVEVLESGEIKYQGQALNKFYIDGSDLLGGRYGLATNNISHKDIASVDIMENHQPVKALEDVVFTGSPAMNIKLKEDAKSRWAGTLKGGAGIPRLWNAEVFAMRFKPKIQSLNTYKGNNTGNESFEMNMFIPTGDFIKTTTQLPSYIYVSPSLASDIGSSRSTFNRTNNFTSNNLFKVGKNFDLISEFTGSFERRQSEQVSQTTYFLGDEQVSVEDKTENARDFKKAFTGKISLKSNQPTYYLNNYLDFSYDRNDPSIDMLGSFPNSQRAGIKNRKVSNDLDILRRIGEKVFTFRSGNAFLSKPQFLEIVKNGLPSVRENIRLSTFYTDNTLDCSIMIGKIRVHSPVRLLYQYRQIEHEADDPANKLNTRKLKMDISPGIECNINDLNISLSGILYYQALSPENRTHHFYGVNPRFSLNWIMSSRITMRTYLSSSNDLPDENLFYSGNMLNNYRNMTAGYIDFSTGKSAYFSTSMEYKDVLKTLFVNLGVSGSKKRQMKVPGQNFEGDYILSYYSPGDMTTEMFSVYGSFSKGIELIGGTVSLFPLYVHNRSSILRNGITLPYTSDSYSLRGNINSKISSNCNLTYQVSYGFSKHQMEVNREYFSSGRLSELLKITYLPIKTLQIGYTFDHYCNELSSNSYRHFFFSDVSISYLPKNRWEFSCSVKNMFNKRYYSYFIENELTSFYRSYTIRPRNILLSATYRF